MKQIKDVEVLKKAFYQGLAEYDNEHGRYVLGDDEIMEIIDSLAVEVPGAKPGAIENALQEYSDALCIDVFTDKQREQAKRECDEARAELVQLQASNQQFMEKDIERDAKMKNLKGALRTLAEMKGCPTIKYADECEESRKHILTCVDCKIAYALANPTEEVEG